MRYLGPCDSGKNAAIKSRLMLRSHFWRELKNESKNEAEA